MSARAKLLLEPILEQQHDLVTTAQAGDVGVHRSAIARLADAGHLQRTEPRVYRRAGSPATWEQGLLAVLLSLGPPAVASHRAVARLLAVPTYEGAPPEISVKSKRNYAHAAVIVHESRDIAYVPPIRLHGIPCTPPLRMAVDIGAVLGETAYTTVLRSLRREHGISWKQLAAILRLHSRHGRDGCGPLRRQLERYYGLDGVPETTLEQDVLDLLIDAWLPLPVCQHVVELPGDGYYRLDFAYVEIKLAIEVDGPHHRLADGRARDAQRDARLRSLGWEVLRFSEEVIAYRPWSVVNEVHRALRARGMPVQRGTQRLPDLWGGGTQRLPDRRRAR